MSHSNRGEKSTVKYCTLNTSRECSALIFLPLERSTNKIKQRAKHAIVQKVKTQGNARKASNIKVHESITVVQVNTGSHYSPKRTELPVYTLLEAMWTSQKVTGWMFWGQIREKLNFLDLTEKLYCRFWGWFAASRTDRLTISDGAMNSELYKQTLQKHVKKKKDELKLKRKWIEQQDSDENTHKLLKQKKCHVLV